MKRQIILGTCGSAVLLGLAALAIPEKLEEEEEAEERASPVAVAIAATLFGSVSVIMLLFYLLNWPSPNLRKYAYDTVSETLAIFCAVMIFQSMQGFVEELFLEHQGPFMCIIVCLVHRMAWHLALQLALAKICKISAPQSAREAVARNYDQEQELEVDLKCWGTLLAHINGFASMNLWGTVQQLPFFAQNWFYSGFALFTAIAFQHCLLYLTDLVREGLISGDGHKDKLESLWDKEAEESENDVMALTNSYLIVQSVRFAICGVLSNVEGEETEEVLFKHPFIHTFCLYFFAGLCLVGYAATVYIFKGDQSLEEEERKEEEQEAEAERKGTIHLASDTAERLVEVWLMTFGMGVAWSVFYASQWGLASASFFDWEDDMTLLTVVLAVSLSMFGFGTIYVLDCLARMDCTGPAVDRILFEIVRVVGILIGLSWEQNFDFSVSALASQTANPILMKLPLSLFVAVLVIPAWKLYILPMKVHQGWRFGFVPKHATQCLDVRDQESVKHYLELVKHFSSFGEHTVRTDPSREEEDPIASGMSSKSRQPSRAYVLL